METLTVSDIKSQSYKFNETEHGRFRILVVQRWSSDALKQIYIIHKGLSKIQSKVPSLYWKGSWDGSFVESLGVALAVLNGNIELIKDAMNGNKNDDFFAKNPDYFDINQGK